MTSLWETASDSHESEAFDRKMIGAREAATDVIEFLFNASSEAEYLNRKGLVSDKLDKAADALAESPADFAIVRAKLEESLDSDFVIAQTQKERDLAEDEDVDVRRHSDLDQKEAATPYGGFLVTHEWDDGELHPTEVFGPSDISDEFKSLLSRGSGRAFQLWDDDGELMARGRWVEYGGSDPLADYGVGMFGATRMTVGNSQPFIGSKEAEVLKRVEAETQRRVALITEEADPDAEGSRKTAATTWDEVLQIIDYSYGLDPFGPGSKGFYVMRTSGVAGPAHDDPFETRAKATAWAKKNWEKFLPKQMEGSEGDWYDSWMKDDPHGEAEEVTASKTAEKYRADVTGLGEGNWSSNAMEFDTMEEVEKYLANLSMNWFGYDLSRIVPVSTPRGEEVDPLDLAIFQDFRTGSRKSATAYRVQHDFTKSQPQWMGDYVRQFGERNEGFLIEAESTDQVRHLLKTEHNLNPFYLTIAKEAMDEIPCPATDVFDGECVYHAGHPLPHRFEGGDEDARYQTSRDRYRDERPDLFRSEDIRTGSRIDQLRAIVDNKQHDDVDGYAVDLFTASGLVQIFDALSEENQEKFETLNLGTLTQFLYKHVARKVALKKAKNDSKKESIKRTANVSKSNAEKVLKAVEKAFASWLTDDGIGPTLAMDYDSGFGSGPGPVIYWEEGPYEWSYLFPDGGIDEEFGFETKSVRDQIPDSVFVESATSYSIALYDA